jgi:hypothetical protein
LRHEGVGPISNSGRGGLEGASSAASSMASGWGDRPGSAAGTLTMMTIVSPSDGRGASWLRQPSRRTRNRCLRTRAPKATVALELSDHPASRLIDSFDVVVRIDAPGRWTISSPPLRRTDGSFAPVPTTLTRPRGSGHLETSPGIAVWPFARMTRMSRSGVFMAPGRRWSGSTPSCRATMEL